MSKVTEVYQDMKINMNDVLSFPILPIKERGLSLKTCKHFGIRTALSAQDGKTPIAYFFPYYDKTTGELCGWKKKDITIPKGEKYHFSVVGSIKEKSTQLFGQKVCTIGGPKLVISEGEFDVAATWQALNDNQKVPGQYIPNVVGLPLGASNAVGCISTNKEFVDGYREKIAVYDNDEAGREALSNTAALIPDIRVADLALGSKDPNDMLMKGKGRELFKSVLWDNKPYAPAGFVTVDDVWEEATSMPTWGKSWPWPSLTKLTYGRRLGEGIYFGAGVKIGKSEAVNQIAHHIVVNEGGKVALFKLEEKPAMTARKVAGKIMHKQFHVPDGPFTQEELQEGVDKIRDGVVLYDSYGSTSWDELKAAIVHAVLVKGCQDIIIDPLTRLTTGMNASDANTELERIADEISKMAKDHGFFYHFFCHLKAPQTGKPHEEGGMVHSNQFTGSRAMMRACYYMVGLQRNKLADDEIERNTTQFVLLEDRAFGNTGRFDVFYNRDNGDYLEPTYDEGY